MPHSKFDFLVQKWRQAQKNSLYGRRKKKMNSQNTSQQTKTCYSFHRDAHCIVHIKRLGEAMKTMKTFRPFSLPNKT